MLQCGFVRSNFSFAIILDSLNVYVVTTIILWKTEEIGAGEGNRTPVISLEGFCSTIELHPLIQTIIQVFALKWWRGMDSNHRRLSRRIYSPLHLTALPPLLIINYKVKDYSLQCISTITANNEHFILFVNIFFAKYLFIFFF